MFDDNFSFDPVPRSPSLDSSNASSTGHASPSISPCSSPTSAQYPFPRYSVTDLAATFANQRIRAESQIYYDSCDAYGATDDDAGWQLDPLPGHSTSCGPTARARSCLPPRPHSPSRRTQRQATARLLCSGAHHKDIAALVARMVESQDQCSIIPPESLSHTMSSAITAEDDDDDEGYDSSDAMTTPSQSRRSSVVASRCRLEFRRSSDMKTTGACVNKAVRLRKAAKHRRVRSSEHES